MRATWSGLFPCRRIVIRNMLIFGLKHSYLIILMRWPFKGSQEKEYSPFTKYEILLLFQGDWFTLNTSPCSKNVSLSVQKWTIGEIKQVETENSLTNSRAWSKVKGPHRSGTWLRNRDSSVIQCAHETALHAVNFRQYLYKKGIFNQEIFNQQLFACK